MKGWLHAIKDGARRIKRDVLVLWIAARDPRTPVVAKLAAGAVAAYALSPFDLIPDVVPVLGYLDDLLIVPVGIILAVRLVPTPLLTEFRAAAAQWRSRPVSKGGLAAVVALWGLTVLGLIWFYRQHLFRA